VREVVEISRAATSRKILTLTCQYVGVQPHICHPPPPISSGVLGGAWHCPTPTYGGLATQVLAPPAGEVRWDHQPRRVPADLPHLYPCSRRGYGHYGQLVPCCLDQNGLVSLGSRACLRGPLTPGRSCAASSRPTSRASMLGQATRPTSTPSNSARGNPYTTSSSSSPRFATPFIISPMLLLWLHFSKE
jgi:hypothetical protein